MLNKQVKIQETEEGINRLKQLPKQHALLLLKKSFANQLRHLLRTMDTTGLNQEVRNIDVLIYDTVDFLRNLPAGEVRTDTESAIIEFPIEMEDWEF